ncbi:FHA domain-containing protein [Synechococcales cyanobacterium C]|uniref:FHA domain-containing protein n=1 Tax=Petrachloros mirabilis ULC683 TaxID=2781853 RepID=A0A8K2A9J7_9CYAN|nr:FHA domain-containing protein [Petrachloros mirabilis]NCJ08105.1 FHA domain-containing protein [Petrachloros mirabilis ULC683]
MPELLLQWTEAGQVKTFSIRDQQPSRHPGTVRLGRDPDQCDLVFGDRSVSGLHAEIYYQPQDQQFYLRNLRPTNPPAIDGISLPQGQKPLHLGSTIQLGRVVLTVARLSAGDHGVLAPPISLPPDLENVYSLQCPNPRCGKVSPYSETLLRQGCPWCGVSLAAAQSIFIPKSKS